MAGAAPAAGQRPVGPPMGWYPDPAGSDQERYWDGTSWTHNLRKPPEVVAPTEPAAVARTSASPAPAPATWTPSAVQGELRPQVGTAPPWQRERPVQLAPWGRRALGFLLDLVLAYVALSVLLSPFAGGHTDDYQQVMQAVQAGQATTLGQLWALLQAHHLGSWMMGMMAAEAVGFLLAFAVQYRFAGATLGQRAADVRVIPAGRAEVQRLGWASAIVRAFVLVLGLALPLGVLVLAVWPLFTSTRQGLHDLAARTQVVRR